MKTFNEHEDNIIELKPSWYKKATSTSTGYFCFELSEAEGVHVTQELWLLNPRTGNKVKFEMYREDGFDGDVFGWNFISNCGQYKLLIIND